MGVPFKEARAIRVEERDAELELEVQRWPEEGVRLPGWESYPERGYASRAVDTDVMVDEGNCLKLTERVLRFPSAPIHGLHRLSQDHVNMGPVESFHTLRLLSHPHSRGKVSRIFFLHNGLNETKRTGLYYQLAAYLIAQDRDTVCVLRPFPGHLTRGASPGLSETPLDHYLWDGLHLYRQFLRYMIETRWLLSTLVRCSSYRCVSGSGLLGESTDTQKSRLETDRLAREMRGEWVALFDASNTAIETEGADSPKMPESAPARKDFEHVIDSLRSALRLDLYGRSDGGSFVPRSEPELHVIGYSLGGFTAQSVFMSWPFLLSSCSTLLSGGAMRELAPTAFADPEEWQTVLHSLRYELDDAMLDRRFTPVKINGKSRALRAAGIDLNLFLYLKRTFYEVFQQEYRGSFQTRLVAFRQRMLFVVGGNDPIVRPKSVLDSGPPDGINLISVGGLGHFLDGSPQGQVEEEQRSFWLPEIGRTIGHLSSAAAEKHFSDLVDTWLDEKNHVREAEPAEAEVADGGDVAEAQRGKDDVDELRLTIAERLEVERDGTLPSRLFQRSLDDLISRATNSKKSDGVLFILKNEVPTFLFDEDALKQHASALYHEDVSINDYVREVRARRPRLEEARERICVVLPWNAKKIICGIDAGLQHPSQSESSGEQELEAPKREQTWRNLHAEAKKWTKDHPSAIRVFDGHEDVEDIEDPPDELADLAKATREWLGFSDLSRKITSALPDCWLWISNEFLGLTATPRIEKALTQLCEVVPPLIGIGDKAERAKAEHEIAAHLGADRLRIVTISRARYNPRFRGRIVAEPRQAQELLLRAALAIGASVPFGKFNFDAVDQVREDVL